MNDLRSNKTSIKNEFDKTHQIKKIDDLLERIHMHSIRGLQEHGIYSLEFFHVVFYQAVEDSLRLVYDQIMGKLSCMYLRDRDALHFIRQRDWKIIEKSFSKTSRSGITGVFMHKQLPNHTAYHYRNYNRAYYQELIIKNDIESRTKFLFAQKFLKTKEDIDSVLEMYC